MIQRIQTVYLLLTTLLSLIFLQGSILDFFNNSGSLIKVTFKGIISNAGGQGFELIEKVLPVSVLVILIPLVSIITILVFKNRKLQIGLSLSVIALIICFIIVVLFYSWPVMTDQGVKIIPGYEMYIPLPMLIFAILAYRGIKHDDRLIKSYDRLR